MHTRHSPLHHDYELKTDRIDVWQYSLLTEFSGANALLSIEEQERGSRFYFPRHQRRFVVAHSVLRIILAHYLNEAPKNLLFTEGAQGKPKLLNQPSLQFNLSHSQDTALLAVGKKYPIGVDLEYFSDRSYRGIGEHLFSSQENQALKNTCPTLAPLVFFNIWAQKEAFIKTCGLGLSYPTQQFTVPILNNKPEEIHDPLHNCSWIIRSFMPQVTCCGALCHAPEVRDIRFMTINPQELRAV